MSITPMNFSAIGGIGGGGGGGGGRFGPTTGFGGGGGGGGGLTLNRKMSRGVSLVGSGRSPSRASRCTWGASCAASPGWLLRAVRPSSFLLDATVTAADGRAGSDSIRYVATAPTASRTTTIARTISRLRLGSIRALPVVRRNDERQLHRLVRIRLPEHHVVHDHKLGGGLELVQKLADVFVRAFEHHLRPDAPEI